MLKNSFTNPHSLAFRVWNTLIATFIFVSCISLALETVPEIERDFQKVLFWIEWISVGIFTLDYLGNLVYSTHGWRYAFTFWGIIDFVSIAPSYFMLMNLTSLQGSKVLRLLRVARILRVLKLARMAASQTGGNAPNPIVANLKIYFIVFFSVMMISSTAMYFVEGDLYSDSAIAHGQQNLELEKPGTTEKFAPTDPISGASIPEDKRFFTSIPAAMWWCVVTLTSTGYGDMYPVTVGGRIVAGITMFFGLVLFGILLNVVGKTLMVLLFAHEEED